MPRHAGDAQSGVPRRYPAACSRPLILKQCLQLPVPLWRELLQLMGGEYMAAARAAYEGGE